MIIHGVTGVRNRIDAEYVINVSVAVIIDLIASDLTRIPPHIRF